MITGIKASDAAGFPIDRHLNCLGGSEAWLGETRIYGVISISEKKLEPSSALHQTSTLTLMPPAQPFVTTRIGGFVCRACLSQLRRPQRPRTPWLTRNATNGPPKAKRPKNKNEEPSVRYFNQTPDGVRTEAVDNLKEAAILKDVEERIGLLEEEEDGLVDEQPSPEDVLDHLKKQYTVPQDMLSAMNEMEAQMADMSSLENLSEEERANIRNRILNFGTEGMSTAL